MSVLSVLLPVAFIGLIAWIAVGIRRSVVESITLPGGVAFYAHLLTIVAVTIALLGVALAVKVFIGFLNLDYSYGSSGLFSSSQCPASLPECGSSSTADFTPQRTNDLALAITLFAVGVALLIIHRLLARAARRLPGGLPAWVQRGTLIGFAALYASGAIYGLVAAVYGTVTFVITPSGASTVPTPSPFGDMVGAAAAFVPAWIVSFVLLVRRMRVPKPVPPPVGATAQPAT